MADLKENLLKIKIMTTDIKTTLSEQLGYTVDKLSDINNLVQDGTISASGVKLFKTIEDMNNDENAQEGDLAIVYRDDSQNWDGKSSIATLTFPKKVVLSEASTGSCYGYASGDTYIDFDGNISSTSASFRIETDSNSYRIIYMSEDGLTYTRTDNYEETITLSDTAITIRMYEYSDVCGYFMRIGESVFEGLYQYDGSTYSIADTQLTAAADYVYNKEFYGKNGIETGTLQNMDSLSTNEINVRVEIWNNINEGIVCPENCYELFAEKSYKTIPKLDTSNVTNMNYMFGFCTSLTSLDVSNFNTSNVTNMKSMFYYCKGLIELGLSNFNTSKVTSMMYMFQNCSSLTELDLSSFDISKVTTMQYMFSDCSSLTKLDLSSFDFANVKYYSGMFDNVPTDCLIYVKDSTAKTWITSKFSTLTKVQIKEVSN